MKVVVAPDKFRGSLTATEAAAAIAAGFRRVDRTCDLRMMPIADGGDGTVDAAVAAGFTRLWATVSGPTGSPVHAAWALRGHTAVIELAEASGLRQLPAAPDPGSAVTAGTHGTGQLVGAALDAGARHIILGLGGSAGTDGGTGIAAALGIEFLDADGRPLPPGGAALLDLARIDTKRLDPRVADVELVLATDVDNQLTGPNGAAHIYSPQKGADPAAVDLLDRALQHLADVVADSSGTDPSKLPGAGAAGGIAATAVPLLGATIRSGSELLLDLFGLPDAIAGADLVITGEGSLDAQTLSGKAPVGVARLAAADGVPTVAVAGRITVTPDQLAAAGIQLAFSLGELEPDPHRSMLNAAALLTDLAERIARRWCDAVQVGGVGSAGGASSPAGP